MRSARAYIDRSGPVILDLAPVAAESARVFHSSIVAAVAADGHWNAWLEFVDPGSGDVLRTGIETHQANEADLHHWASVLSDVYLQGAVGRATVSRGKRRSTAGLPARPD